MIPPVFLRSLPAGKAFAATVSSLTALVLAFGLFAAEAGAVEASGESVATLGSGKAGKKLTRQGVRFRAISPATVKRLKKGKARISAEAKGVKVSENARVDLRGGIVLKRGKRQLKLRGLVFKANLTSSKPNLIKAKLGGSLTNVAKVVGRPAIDPVAGTVAVDKGKVYLTGKGLKKTKKKLKLKKSPKGVIGKLDLGGQVAFEDPYFAECGIQADTKTAGNLPAPAPLPLLTDPVSSTGNPITWGVKASLRGYIAGIGEITGLDGATVNRLPFPGPPPTGFTWPDDADYAANGAEPADDQAILSGSGSILFCNQAHGFRIVISNPTVVVDGEDSRLIADVDTNVTDLSTGITNWIPSQRIDFANLDTAAVTPDTSVPGQVTWPDVPTSLTAAAGDALRLCEGNPGPCDYVEGSSFDPISVTVKTTG